MGGRNRENKKQRKKTKEREREKREKDGKKERKKGEKGKKRKRKQRKRERKKRERMKEDETDIYLNDSQETLTQQHTKQRKHLKSLILCCCSTFGKSFSDDQTFHRIRKKKEISVHVSKF